MKRVHAMATESARRLVVACLDQTDKNSWQKAADGGSGFGC